MCLIIHDLCLDKKGKLGLEPPTFDGMTTQEYLNNLEKFCEESKKVYILVGQLA